MVREFSEPIIERIKTAMARSLSVFDTQEEIALPIKYEIS